MKNLLLALCVALLVNIAGGFAMAAMDPVIVKESPAIKASPAELQGIIKAIEHYINAGRKGDSKIAAEGFAPSATMSWVEDGKMKSVPIQELYKYFDEKPREAFCELTACEAAGDVAAARIESEFEGARFTDMFTLVKDGDVWKIVSKVYHIKK